MTGTRHFGFRSGKQYDNYTALEIIRFLIRMDSNLPHFQQLLTELRGGSDVAATKLVEEYAPYILRAVRRTLHRDIRTKFDSIDFAQAVWCSFFSRPDKLHQLETPEQLIRLLSTMSRNKVVDEVRRRKTKKHDVNREERHDDADGKSRVKSREPTPSQVAIVREEWNRMIADLTPCHREVLSMRLRGETHNAIAEKLEISTKTVQRVLRTTRE